MEKFGLIVETEGRSRIQTKLELNLFYSLWLMQTLEVEILNKCSKGKVATLFELHPKAMALRSPCQMP